MRSKKRQFSAISLSFLDVMSCGFGAFILLFLIIKHQANVAFELPENYLEIEISKLNQQIIETTTLLKTLSESSSITDQKIGNLEKQLAKIRETIATDKSRLNRNKNDSSLLAMLQLKIKKMELERDKLARLADSKPSDVRTFVGEGDREYLTGMQLGGKRILILLDHSASMLDKSIVNIIRKRNMSDARKRKSEKWKQAIATVDWITARFPEDSKYQIHGFSDTSQAILSGTEGKWLNVSNLEQLESVFDRVQAIVPSGGSSLENAFVSIKQLKPSPDNIYLITDGLPTMGSSKPIKTTVSGKKRLKLFESAVENLPADIPVNTILLPMEGDPLAPWAFWGIAAVTKGSFLSPASDWP